MSTLSHSELINSINKKEGVHNSAIALSKKVKQEDNPIIRLLKFDIK